MHSYWSPGAYSLFSAPIPDNVPPSYIGLVKMYLYGTLSGIGALTNIGAVTLLYKVVKHSTLSWS
jgi:hypothetical protein